METATQNNAAPAEQGAGQPAATGTTEAPAEQSAPTKSVAEVKLEKELKDAKTKGDGYKRERDTAAKERDDLRLENGQLKADNERLTQELADAKAPAATTQATSTATAEAPSEEEYIKGLLKRNGLTKAWMLPTGACFSEDHAREYAGTEFDSLTVVTLD